MWGWIQEQNDTTDLTDLVPTISDCLLNVLVRQLYMFLFCRMEVKYQGQNDLLIAITYAKEINVWEHVFSPKEYLISHLEEYFAK